MDLQAEITQRRNEFVAAFNCEDLAQLRTFCADDIVMMPPNQPPILGVAAAMQWWSTGFTAGRTTMHILPREIYVTDGWAMEWFDWSVQIVPLGGGMPSIDAGSTFCVWRRVKDEGWRIHRTMWRSHSEIPSLWGGGAGDFPLDDTPLM